MAIGKQLEALLKEKNKKPGTLASEIGISKNTLYSIIRRDNDKVSHETLERIAGALGVPVSYFFAGAAMHPDMRAVSVHRVPILGSAACGEPIYKPGDDTEYIDVDSELPCDFALIAQGDSMTGDRIHSGDIVFIRKQDSVRDGEIAAIALDDELTLKRVRRITGPGGRVAFTQLLPSNPSYSPIDIGGEDETRCVKILGKAVAVRFML